MSGNRGLERFIVLYIPWILATLLQSDALVSYWIAWGGSFLIFFLTISGWVKPIPDDRPLTEQMMRPLFIMHIIFAGYMSCTSVFYMLDALGYVNFVKTVALIDPRKIESIAQCQRYYCLGHASFISGILMFMKYPKKKKYHIDNRTIASLLLNIAIISFPVSNILGRLPGLSQLSLQLNSLSFIAGTLALAFAIPLKKPVNTLISGLLYAFNFYVALVSGFKEPIIISIMVLGLFLYPNYKKFVLITFVPLLFFCFMILPAYVNSYRSSAWADDNIDSDAAAQASLNEALEGQNDNWDFLVLRLSEIDMFITFTQSTPATIPYYGTTLLQQSIIVVVPRIFWPSKPITEALVMERVYAAGVVNRLSTVSAKPAYIVDAYLSGGIPGIFIALFAYGAIAQLISIKAEELFGGYILGTALVFSGLFQIFWRGLSFEFIINAVFWSYVTMFIVFEILKYKRILKKV